MRVPLIDLKAQYRDIRNEVLAVVQEVCEEQGFILGRRVAEVEEALARYLGCAHAVGVASGSDALLLALLASGVKQGDDVITVPYTFFATTGAISRLGARPVFVDISPDTFNMDPGLIEDCITKKTRAIIPVHLFGQCADMEAITDIARRRGLRVIEDAAQAMGATRRAKKAGTIGDTGCFSFFPSKTLGGFGDGGLVATNAEGCREAVAMLRVHGTRVKYSHEHVGINSRLDALQAAVLQVKLKYLDGWIEGRRRNAERYARLFQETGLGRRIVAPKTAEGNVHVFNQFTVRAQHRDQLRNHLTEQGVGTEIYYPVPLHLQPCYRELGYEKGSFPVSESASEEVLSLPMYPELTSEQQTYVVEAITAFYATV